MGYADDVALISSTVEDMTRRLTSIANGARDNADMHVSLPKTFTHHVHKRDKLKVTAAEAKAEEKSTSSNVTFAPEDSRPTRTCRFIGAIAFIITTPPRKYMR